MVISFEPSVIRAIEQAQPGLETALLVSPKRQWDGSFKPSLNDILTWAQAIQCDSISVKADPLMALDFGERVKKTGFSFHVWTVDEPAWAQEMARRGADSITTNKPDIIRQALEDKS